MTSGTSSAKVIDLSAKLADKKRLEDRELYRKILDSVKHIGEPLPAKAKSPKVPS